MPVKDFNENRPVEKLTFEEEKEEFINTVPRKLNFAESIGSKEKFGTFQRKQEELKRPEKSLIDSKKRPPSSAIGKIDTLDQPTTWIGVLRKWLQGRQTEAYFEGNLWTSPLGPDEFWILRFLWRLAAKMVDILIEMTDAFSNSKYSKQDLKAAMWKAWDRENPDCQILRAGADIYVTANFLICCLLTYYFGISLLNLLTFCLQQIIFLPLRFII